MIDANSPKPLYQQIKDYILHNIHSGEFSPDTRIPSERDLSKKFGVSRLTVNKALKELVQAGWLYVRIGKGTFIRSDPIDQALDTLSSFTEEMTKRGQQATSLVLVAKILPASDEVARILDVLPGIGVTTLKRVRLANEQPIAVETSSIVGSLCPNLLERHDFAHESLYGVLRQEYGLHLTYAEQTFEARQATQDEAQALDIEIGTPILNISRVTYTEDNRPVEYVRSAYRGDRYKFRAVLRRI